jgi:hypothetical protein
MGIKNNCAILHRIRCFSRSGNTYHRMILTSNALHVSTEYLISDIYIESIILVFISANIILLIRKYFHLKIFARLQYAVQA